MEFTQVRAPISGRISDRKVDVGNLVAAGEGRMPPCSPRSTRSTRSISTSTSEASSSSPARHRAQGGAPQVEIKLQDESGYNWKGRLDFTDNGLDPHSGTIRAGRSSPTPSCS
jgi:multidrug efflux pump subunit AcrA (membrane-fusion protein)